MRTFYLGYIGYFLVGNFTCRFPLTKLPSLLSSFSDFSSCIFQGQDSISDYAISFHYVSPPKMYALEFFIYHLRPYGISSKDQDLNQKRAKT